MKRILISLLCLLSWTLPMWAAVDGKKFQFSYPEASKDHPYNLGYQYSKYDLGESDVESWRVMTLEAPVTLTYNITSEENKTVEVVFDPSYMEIVDIVIPDKVIDPETGTEYTVTAIGKMAFDDCPEIRSVIMANSITRIEDYAFNMCENKVLHKIGFIKFSKNLTHIGNYAFKNCHNLTTGQYIEGDQYEIFPVDFVDNVEYPFYGYAGRLTGLDNYLLLPASVEYIGKHAFEGCYFEREDNHLNYGLCKVKIPNPSCVIDDYAFAGCKFLELITIGDELNYDGLKNPNPDTNKKGRIGDYAFANCNLMRLDIPSSIESIGENAFINCFNRKAAKNARSQDEGWVYFDALNWFYPRSLFDNDSSRWHSWNFETSEGDNTPIFYDKFTNYLKRWHTNTVTIYSDETEIGKNAFAQNPQLEKVVITGNAGDIHDGAFRNCSSLIDVEFPEDLTKLSNSMFMNCSALNTITIPENVTEIGDSAFYKCKKLETIELPSKLQKVNPYTFYGCEELSLSTLPGEVSSIGNHAFFGCKGITTFTIPYKVTTIGEYAFADCYRHEKRINPDYGKGLSSDPYIYLFGLTQVKISDGVQTIGAHAFDGCRHLGKIEMGKNVREIGDYAFQNCMSCPEVDCKAENNALTLPDSFTKMGTGAFQGCTYLPGITLGNNMTELPDFAFAYCSKLSYIQNINNIKTVQENTFLGCYSLADFGNLYANKGKLKDGIIYNDNYTEVISALPNVTVVDLSKTNVTKICDDAFANCGALQSVSFPVTLKEIGSCAFSNCGSLKSLEFPNSLEEIGSRAFENCISLQSADLINVKMGEFVYAGCTGIKKVTIAEDFTQDLQDNWFAGCINMSAIAVKGDNERYSSHENQLLLNKEEDTLLRAPSGISSLVLPESVTKIGEYACSNCINLSDVEIPSTVTHIGAHAFDGCYMEGVDSEGELNSWGLQNVYFMNTAVTIDEYAFNNCKFLSIMDWSWGDAKSGDMGSIGAFAFNNCEKLIFSSKDLTYAVIKSLKPYAFANFPGIEDIELPETLESIGDHAFENCQKLTSVVFPDSLKSIGNSAFKSSGLTSLYLPDNIEEIGDSAFMDCSKVMALKLPAGLKEIKPYTFYKCFSGAQFDEQPENFNLAIEIPDSVESIGDYAFYRCVTNSNKFHKEGKQSYSQIHHFYYYGLSSLSIGKNVKTIGAHAFDGCSHLLEVTMGDAVTSIGDYAFKDCFSELFKGVREIEYTLTGHIEKPLDSYPIVWELKDYAPQSITLPDKLSSLGEGAFSGCKELPSINYPAALTEIPAQAFNGCKNIKKIELPEGLLSIGDGAFGGCKRVKEISIPASLENASRAFVDCDSAFTVTYLAEVPRSFDEGFFSPKVYASYDATLSAPNSLLENLKGINPWALFYKIEAKDETLLHLERVLEVKNGLRFRVLSNKPNPYCEVAGPAEAATEPTTYEVPEYVKNIDPNSEYFGKSYKVIRIGNDAFENDLTLVGITIPEGVIDIGQEAFNGCKNLPEINLPNSITNMGERAFNQCYGLTYFEVPPLVTRLNPGVLRDCRGLNVIRMHDNIEELCEGALMDCRHLRRFDRSENWKLKLIDDYALKNCIELEEINIPEGVVKIGKEAMYYCQKLNTASLPKSLEEIGENAFDDCEVLSTIKVYTETIPKILGEANLTEPQCKIYVQAKCLDAYKELWKIHEHRIEPGIIVTQPTRKEMPEYIPGDTYLLSSMMYLDGQTMTWKSKNTAVAAEPGRHDGTMELKAVGRSLITVETDKKFYHEATLDVYPQPADANWDGRFDVSDAVNIANYALQNPGALNNWWKNDRQDFESEALWNHFYYVGADLNKDNSISVSDASAAVKTILAAPASRSALTASRAASAGHADALVIGLDPSGSRGEVTVPVGLDNSLDYVAIQADIRVPEGTMLRDVTAGTRAARHTLTSRRIDDRTMRVVLFDLNSSAFAPTDEPLLNLTVEGGNVSADAIEISGIFASDAASRSYELTSRVGKLSSGIDTVSAADFSVGSTVDGITIGNAAGKTVAIYTVDGRLINTFVAASDSETFSLAKGIYIVSVGGNSTKIAVK